MSDAALRLRIKKIRNLAKMSSFIEVGGSHPSNAAIAYDVLHAIQLECVTGTHAVLEEDELASRFFQNACNQEHLHLPPLHKSPQAVFHL